MFKAIQFSTTLVKNVFLTGNAEQVRYVMILKRKWPIPLNKKEKRPHILKTKSFVYELVEDTDQRKHEEIRVVLTSYVEGLGLRGDVVSVRPHYARVGLLLPGLAQYATPENIAKYKTDNSASQATHSSPLAEKTIRDLRHQILNVIVNIENPWTLEKWHVRSAFRRAGFWVPDHALVLPEKPISGPNLDIEGKEFLVRVTINNTESTPVRCRIHHWSTELKNKLPYLAGHWLLPAEPLFTEQAEIIQSLPRPLNPVPATK